MSLLDNEYFKRQIKKPKFEFGDGFKSITRLDAKKFFNSETRQFNELEVFGKQTEFKRNLRQLLDLMDWFNIKDQIQDSIYNQIIER